MIDARRPDPLPTVPAEREGVAIEVRPLDAAAGVIVTVTGPEVARHDAETLGVRLHAELDPDPTVVVINLSTVARCDAAAAQVLTEVRDRARALGVALHLVHLGDAAARRWLVDAGLLGRTRDETEPA